MFCKKVQHVIKDAYDWINEHGLEVATEVIQVTGNIKAIYDSPTIQAIEAALGIGRPVHAWIDAALTKIYNIEVTGKTLAQKLLDLLNAQPTDTAKNMMLEKVASVATSIGDGTGLSESKYDALAKIAIATFKIPD